MSQIGYSKYNLGKPVQVFCTSYSVSDLRNVQLPSNTIIVSSPIDTYTYTDNCKPAIIMTDSVGKMLPLTYTISGLEINETYNTASSVSINTNINNLTNTIGYVDTAKFNSEEKTIADELSYITYHCTWHFIELYNEIRKIKNKIGIS